METVEGAARGSVIVFLPLFAVWLIFSRFWCGRLCPGGGLQEICGGIDNRRVQWNRNDIVRLVVWVPWIASFAVLAIKAGNLKSIDILQDNPGSLFAVEGKTFGIYYLILTLMGGLAIVAGRRAFCYYVCWMSPFMIIGSWFSEKFGWSALKLLVEPDLCSRCGLCTKYCPVGVDFQKRELSASIYDAECILCGECVDCCPRKSIEFSYQPPFAQAKRESVKYMTHKKTTPARPRPEAPQAQEADPSLA